MYLLRHSGDVTPVKSEDTYQEYLVYSKEGYYYLATALWYGEVFESFLGEGMQPIKLCDVKWWVMLDTGGYSNSDT